MTDASLGSGLTGLKLDTAELRDTAVVLGEVSRGFDVDQNLLAIALEGVGSPVASGRPRGAGIWKLDQALTAFAGQWRVRRENVRESVERLAGTVTLVADHFDAAERSLTGAIAPPALTYSGNLNGRTPDGVRR